MSTLIATALDDDGDDGWAGGVGVGVPEADWPRFEGQPMEHLLTLKRTAIWTPLPDHVAAVAVFQSKLEQNEAFLPDTKESVVLFLREEQLTRPSWPDAPVGAKATRLRAERVAYEFDDVATFDDEDERKSETDLDEEQQGWAVTEFMNQHDAFIHSAPHTVWLQACETPDGHKLLFWVADEMLEGTNFGTGVLYVSANEGATNGCAWFQC